VARRILREKKEVTAFSGEGKMKQVLLAGTAVLGLVASGLAVRATPIDFTYSGSLVDFTVPATGTYQIIAFGAQGGSVINGFGQVSMGGLGAEIGGDFTLSAGDVLQVAVGGSGGNGTSSGPGSASGGGGGGGSFVVAPGNAPLVIAGGGGGGGAFFGSFPGESLPGQGGLIGRDGGGNGGTNGNGGGAADGAGGGGFFTAGANAAVPELSLIGATGGGSFPGLAGGDGIDGGGNGGFGGGGGAGPLIHSGAGGGGGYSGGGGGFGGNGAVAAGGGGGSFDGGIDQILVADFQTGNGEVVITELVPEPASLALLGSALIGLAVVWRRRRPGTFGLRGD
jgi:hypothetical protein